MSRDRGASAEGAESIRSEAGFGIPEIIAGEIDVLPADRGKVGEQRCLKNFAAATQVIERTVEIYGVPERDSGSNEGNPARTVLLRLECTIAQSAEAVEADSTGEGIAPSPLLGSSQNLPERAR